MSEYDDFFDAEPVAAPIPIAAAASSSSAAGSSKPPEPEPEDDEESDEEEEESDEEEEEEEETVEHVVTYNEDDDEAVVTTTAKLPKKDLPQWKDPYKTANDRLQQGLELLSDFRNVEEIGSADVECFAGSVLKLMYSALATFYDDKDEATGVYFFAGLYTELANPSAWTCLALQIGMQHACHLNEGYQSGTPEAATRWLLVNLHKTLLAYKGRGFSSNETKQGEERDVARTGIGPGTAGKRSGAGVSALGRQLHHRSETDHRRRRNIHSLGDEHEQRRKILGFIKLYELCRRQIQGAQDWPDIDPRIIANQPPDVFVPLNVQRARRLNPEGTAQKLIGGFDASRAETERTKTFGVAQGMGHGTAAAARLAGIVPRATKAKATIVIKAKPKLADRRKMKQKRDTAAAREAEDQRDRQLGWKAEFTEQQLADYESWAWHPMNTGGLSEDGDRREYQMIRLAAKQAGRERRATAIAKHEAEVENARVTALTSALEAHDAEYEAKQAAYSAECAEMIRAKAELKERVYPVTYDELGYQEMIEYDDREDKLPEAERRIWNWRPVKSQWQTEYQIKRQSILAKYTPKTKSKTPPTPKQRKVLQLEANEPGSFVDYCVAFDLDTEQNGSEYLAEMIVRKGSGSIYSCGWQPWEMRFWKCTHKGNQQGLVSRLYSDEEQWREELAEARAAAAKRYDPLGANPYWDKRKGCIRVCKETGRSMQAEFTARQRENAAKRRAKEQRAEDLKDRRAKRIEDEAAKKRETAKRAEASAAKRRVKATNSANHQTKLAAGRKQRFKKAWSKGTRRDRRVLRTAEDGYNREFMRLVNDGPPADGTAVTMMKPMRDANDAPVFGSHPETGQRVPVGVPEVVWAEGDVKWFEDRGFKRHLNHPRAGYKAVNLKFGGLSPYYKFDGPEDLDSGVRPLRRHFNINSEDTSGPWDTNPDGTPNPDAKDFLAKRQKLCTLVDVEEVIPAAEARARKMTFDKRFSRDACDERFDKEYKYRGKSYPAPGHPDLIVIHPACSEAAIEARVRLGMATEGKVPPEPEPESDGESDLGSSVAASGAGDGDDDGDAVSESEMFGDSDSEFDFGDDGDEDGPTDTTTDVPSSVQSSAAGPAEDEMLA